MDADESNISLVLFVKGQKETNTKLDIDDQFFKLFDLKIWISLLASYQIGLY